MKKVTFCTLLVFLLSTGLSMAATNFCSKYLNNKEYDKALEACTKQLTENGWKKTSAYNNRGIVYLRTRVYQKALDDFTKAIEMDPEYKYAYINRGAVYGIMGDYEKAISDYSKAIEIDDWNRLAYYKRGLMYNKLGKFYKAVIDYSDALEVDPEYKFGYYSRGMAFRNMGEPQKAVKDYSRAIEIDPKYVAAYQFRGDAYKNWGKFQEAIKDYNQALTLSPKAEYAHLGLVIASAKISKLKLAAALSGLREFTEENPSQKFVRTLSNYFIGQKEITEENVLAKALNGKDVPGETCEAYYYMGEKRLWQGDKKGAIAFFKKSFDTKVFSFTEYSSSMAMLNLLGEKIAAKKMDQAPIRKRFPGYTKVPAKIQVKPLDQPEKNSPNWEYVIKSQLGPRNTFSRQKYYLGINRWGNWYGFYDLKRNKIITNKAWNSTPRLNSEGIGFVRTRKGYIIINHDGEQVFDRTFGYIGYFSEGVAVAGDVDSGGKYLIDETGKKITPKYHDMKGISEGRVPFWINDTQCGYLNKKGETVIPAKFTQCSYFNQGIATVSTKPKKTRNREFFFIDDQGKVLFGGIKTFENANFGRGVAFVQKIVDVACDKKTNGNKEVVTCKKRLIGAIDKNGKLVIPYEYMLENKTQEQLNRYIKSEGSYSAAERLRYEQAYADWFRYMYFVYNPETKKCERLSPELPRKEVAKRERIGFLSPSGKFYKHDAGPDLPKIVRQDAPFWAKLQIYQYDYRKEGKPGWVKGNRYGLRYRYDGMEKEKNFIPPQFHYLGHLWGPYFMTKQAEDKEWSLIKVKE